MIEKNRVSFRTFLASANDEFSTHDFSKPTFSRYRLWGTSSLFRGRCQGSDEVRGGRKGSQKVTTVGCLARSLWETEESTPQPGSPPPSLVGHWLRAAGFPVGVNYPTLPTLARVCQASMTRESSGSKGLWASRRAVSSEGIWAGQLQVLQHSGAIWQAEDRRGKIAVSETKLGSNQACPCSFATLRKLFNLSVPLLPQL